MKTLKMKTKIFRTYKEAAGLARKLAISHKTTIRLGRKDSSFFVEVPQSYSVSNKFSKEYLSEEHITPEDYVSEEIQKEIEEINKEFIDYADSMARSDEDGWFYSDYDYD